MKTNIERRLGNSHYSMWIAGKRTITLLVIMIISLTSVAQTTISGTITDAVKGDPIQGVTVFVENKNAGTTTDGNGKYTLQLPVGSYSIIYSYVGYQQTKKQIQIGNKPVIVNVELKESEVSLNEVVITGKSEARQIREQAMPISVISMKELQGTVSDVSELLSKVSGVKIRTSGGVGSSSRISVRGLEGKRIGFFIDEAPLSDNTDFLDINDIPVDLIDRVEIYKGVVPAKLGGSAVGGAVNIVLKEYPARYLDASYSIQSYNTHKASTVFKRNKNGIEAGVGGFYTYSDNNYKMELPLQPGKYVERDHDKFEKLVIGGGLTSKVWWFDEVKFEPAMIFSKKEIQGIEYNIQEAKSLSNAYVLSNKLVKKNFLTDGLDLDIDNAYAYTIFKFQDKAMNRYTWDGELLAPATIYGGEIGMQPNDAYNQKHTFLQKINLNYLINKNHSINFNSQYNFAKGIPQDTLKDMVIGYRTNFNSTMNSFVAGFSHEFNSTNRKVTNSLTAKYYFYSMQTQLVDLYGIDHAPKSVNMNKHDYGLSEAFRYRFSPDFLGKVTLGYDVRLPSENELLGDGFIIAPAGNLQPERNASLNLGVMYDVTNKQNNRFQLEINGFYMQLENMIRFTGGPLQSMYQNFGEMRTLGAELEVKWDATKNIYLWGNTTYQDLRDTREYEPGSTVLNPTKGDRMPNIPYFFANAGIEFHKENLFGGKGQNTRLFSEGSFIEEYFYDFEQSIYQERRIPRSLTFNFGAEHSFGNQSTFIGLQINNITNTKLISEFNRPLPGRNFGLKLRRIFK